MEIESRKVKWYKLNHKGEDMDKVEEDNVEHKWNTQNSPSCVWYVVRRRKEVN